MKKKIFSLQTNQMKISEIHEFAKNSSVKISIDFIYTNFKALAKLHEFDDLPQFNEIYMQLF